MLNREMFEGRYLYHATDARNTESILEKGILRGIDACVYLAETPDDALSFLMFRWDIEDVVVFKIDTRKMTRRKIRESFDHSFEFFKCRAWYYNSAISAKAIESHTLYRRKETEPVVGMDLAEGKDITVNETYNGEGEE